jgi:hypothetical protein
VRCLEVAPAVALLELPLQVVHLSGSLRSLFCQFTFQRTTTATELGFLLDAFYLVLRAEPLVPVIEDVVEVVGD